MTPLTIPCACPGCPNPRRDNSIYCSKRCSNRASKLRERARHLLEPKQPQTHKCGVYGTNKTVTVMDPKCGDSYRITPQKYRQYAGEYLPGTKVIIDGAEMVL